MRDGLECLERDMSSQTLGIFPNRSIKVFVTISDGNNSDHISKRGKKYDRMHPDILSVSSR